MLVADRSPMVHNVAVTYLWLIGDEVVIDRNFIVD